MLHSRQIADCLAVYRRPINSDIKARSLTLPPPVSLCFGIASVPTT
tara:strand:- start:187 stop:324 length:138 start_codon:yes stop_codon:yes gene_type:complete